ncbi:MAG: regulatory protein GemA [Alphaproteobacteria bacterium]|nr:regulatory protein GemA [Alphaproteobacteria bacterium]
MSAARKFKTEGNRKGLISKVKIGQKEIGWDDDLYRDVLEQRYGKTSSTQLTYPELEDLINHMKEQGFKPKRRAPARAGARTRADGSKAPLRLADDEQSRKMRALWISLYNLAVVRDPKEAALIGFARRVSGGRDCGKQALQFLDGEETVKVIEALKAWAVRDGGVSWEPYRRFIGSGVNDFEAIHQPRARVIEAQWRILLQLGVVYDPRGYNNYAARISGNHAHTHLMALTEDELDKAEEALGAQIRKALATIGYASYPDWKKARAK